MQTHLTHINTIHCPASVNLDNVVVLHVEDWNV